VITVTTVLPGRYEVLTEMVTNIIIVFVGVTLGGLAYRSFCYTTRNHISETIIPVRRGCTRNVIVYERVILQLFFGKLLVKRCTVLTWLG
jgi:hypothetical protein